MTLPIYSDNAIIAIIAALRNDAAGNAQATMTDIDFAADMLLSLMNERALLQNKSTDMKN